MRPLICGLPSDSLCSCLTSWCDIFRRSLKKNACNGTSTMAARNTTNNSKPMPVVSQLLAWRRAAGEGWSTKTATWSMLPPKYFQATAARMLVISTILATLAICCLENRLAAPEMGLRRLNCGVIGLRLKIQPPAPIALTNAAAPVRVAKAALARMPINAMPCSRVSMYAGVCTVVASNTSCCPMACSIWSNSGCAKTSMLAAPVPRMARCDRSRERATWPSVRAFWSLRSVAGRLRS